MPLPNKTISYRITSINELEFNIHNFYALQIPTFELSKIGIRYGWMSRPDKDTKEIILLISVAIIYKVDENNEFPLVNYSNGTHFGIDNFDDVVKNITDISWDFSDEVMATFLSISISTIRGILIEKLARTPYNQIILPPVTLDFIHQLQKNRQPITPPTSI
jgi:hypothetical protein